MTVKFVFVAVLAAWFATWYIAGVSNAFIFDNLGYKLFLSKKARLALFYYNKQMKPLSLWFLRAFK